MPEMTKMKRIFNISIAILCFVACQQPAIDFDIDTKTIEIGPDGGVKTINVESSDSWIATTAEPWLSISPANGSGSQEIQVRIDSSLDYASRSAVVRIKNLLTQENSDFTVTQDGYVKHITVDKKEVKVGSYADYDKRKFDVAVTANVNFTPTVKGEKTDWIIMTSKISELDRGARPRKSILTFEWSLNSRPESRNVEVELVPEGGTIALNDKIVITQDPALEIEEGVEGDSLALLAIARGLGMWSEWDTSDLMRNWNNVDVWEEDDPGYKEEYKGRVRYARFFMFSTQEEIPYEVQFLTAAHELSFYSNANSFLKSLNPGEHITKLTNLKRLTIGAYGLTELPESFVNMKALEYLNLESNNFQVFPSIITADNFPNLHALIMNANQRTMIEDLSNTTKENYGGFADTKYLPNHLFKWDKLDTLRLSYNYFQGALPSMEGHTTYTAADLCDTIPTAMIGKPKVLPNMKMLSINGNRLVGELPEWLLYHPKLDMWAPYILVFAQEGKDKEGNEAGFTNEPGNMDYYYDFYTSKENPGYTGED